MKIISTVPSQTELLFDLGLDNEVVGITKFCIHPKEWFKSKERIGGTKTLNIDKILKLNPDLIIANKEENTKEQIELLQNHTEVFVSDIKTLSDNYNLIEKIGGLTDRNQEATNLITKTKSALDFQPTSTNKKAVYLIWKEPYMTIGSDTFINDVLNKCGFKNLFDNQTRYPQTNLEEIKKLKPEYILLSSEPYPFKVKHIDEISKTIPNCRVILVDGEAFSWYGSRLLKKSEYLKEMSMK
jgi:ABC-type Fe3+-hydroxamate transport system substrate-binding protein